MQANAETSYRLPGATRIGRVVLRVADLERSIDYYGAVIGLALLRREGDRAELGVEDTDTVLVEFRAVPDSRPVGPHGQLGLFHVAILLPTRQALGQFVRHLAERGERAGASDHLVSEALYLHDPDGHGIEVYADRDRATWVFNDGQIAMATEPLDTAGLAAAAGDEPWRGVPAGTTIGHVHLRVADVDAATPFYHTGLGLDRTVWNYPGALFLSAGGYHHHVGVNAWSQRAQRPADHDARLLEWELLLPADEDVKALLQNLERSGHAVVRDVAGNSAADPWGTVVRIRAGR